jgi:hypothetical protein
MIFYGTEEEATAELQRKAATEVDPALTPDEVASILSQAKRADIYGRWPSDASWVPSWEMDWACAEVWDAKAAKVASRNQSISDARGTANSFLWLNCTRSADKHRERIVSSAPVVKKGRPYQRLIV